jgi:hypothetical protein
VPILLSIQIDSVGIGDGDIPVNVHRAANFYQTNGHIVHGEPIRADDPKRTTVLFNQHYDYASKEVKVNKPWWKKAFRSDHVKMDNDPDVWNQVQSLIVQEIYAAK